MKALPLLALCAVVAPFAVYAGTPPDAAPTIKVPYAPNSLVNPSEVARLETKIQFAAHHVCVDEGTRGLERARHEQSCYARTMRAAHTQEDAARAYAVATYSKPSAG
jgi:UrcA family protein